jgi:hypothetical protein
MSRRLLKAVFLVTCGLMQPMGAQSGKNVVSTKQGETPFACNLKAMNAEERKRYDKLSEMLFPSVQERRELPEGYAFRLAATVSMPAAAEWAELESKCCPFFDFHLEKSREHGALWLQLTGRPGVKQFIREEFRF